MLKSYRGEITEQLSGQIGFLLLLLLFYVSLTIPNEQCLIGGNFTLQQD